MESGTMACEITARKHSKMAQWQAKSGLEVVSIGTMASEINRPGGTIASETATCLLARYQRNDWHYIMKMGGTMASELSKDTEWTFVGDITLKGKEAVRQWMAENYIEPPKFDVKNLITENDFVTAIGEIEIANKNGTTGHYSYCDVWRFRDGKMAGLMAFVIEIKETAS